MRFCTICQNMYYIRINEKDTNKLVYYCRNCGNEHELLESETANICVSKTQIKKNKQNFNNIVNKYTRLDPTLPRINTIPCPNPNCATNHASNPEPREIIYIRYDDTNMKYIYLCTSETCNFSWKIDDLEN
jgi:DNA-directed RNA polymerase subunit M/transcription elongation factor TFIIS